MKITETELSGCFVLEQELRGDDRGNFARVFCVDEMSAHGMCTDVAQANTAYSAKAGTLRGMHYQRAPHAEDKLVRCTAGRFFDVAVDLREDSSTFRQWFGIELSVDNGMMLYVPKGFAHGYLTLDDNTVATYMVSAGYSPESEAGFCWDDSAVGIEWPLKQGLELSDKDKQWAPLSS